MSLGRTHRPSGESDPQRADARTRFSGSATTAHSTPRRPRCSTPTSSACSRSRRRRTAPRATAWRRPSWARSSATISAMRISATPRRYIHEKTCEGGALSPTRTTANVRPSSGAVSTQAVWISHPGGTAKSTATHYRCCPMLSSRHVLPSYAAPDASEGAKADYTRDKAGYRFRHGAARAARAQARGAPACDGSSLSVGMRFRAMRAKRTSSLSCRANFAESLMHIL